MTFYDRSAFWGRLSDGDDDLMAMATMTMVNGHLITLYLESILDADFGSDSVRVLS